MESKFLALPSDLQIVAVCSRCGRCWTGKTNRLTALKRRNPVDRPTAKRRVGNPTGVKESLILTERKLIPAAEMEDLAEVEIGKTPIETGTKPWHPGSPVPACAAAVQQIAGIGKRLRPRVGQEVRQPVRELLFQLGLQAVVGADSDGPLVTRVLPEVREWDGTWDMRIDR